jgi:FAD/FMN-containing dehydrogenase
MKRRDFLGSSLALAASWPMRGLAEGLKDLGDLPARTLAGGDVLLKGSSVEALSASLRGDLLLPGGTAYDAARRVWNGMFDKRPALIVRCTGAADVIEAVNFAREHQLLTAVRGGGHSFSGKSTCDGGILIDTAPMQGCRVDAEAKRAYLEAGSLLGQLDRETQVFGLATTAGTVSHTGAAGLTLGGGTGRLGRRFGLACDNVASFDIVTADGRFLHVTESEHPDLYWGLRGGGGNFGVVTTFEYRLHHVDPVVLAGDITWPLDQARDAMRFYVGQALAAPDELNISGALATSPDGTGVFNVEVCWSGDHAKGEAAVKALRSFGKPLKDTVGPMKYVTLQSAGDGGTPWGLNYYAKNGFLSSIDEAGIDLILDVARSANGRFFLLLDQMGGAYGRVAQNATAYANRNAVLWLGLIGGWKDPAENEERLAAMRAGWKQLEPITDGFYNNLAGEASSASLQANFGGNYERLVALKAQYDPMNLFRLNANIPTKA